MIPAAHSRRAAGRGTGANERLHPASRPVAGFTWMWHAKVLFPKVTFGVILYHDGYLFNFSTLQAGMSARHEAVPVEQSRPIFAIWTCVGRPCWLINRTTPSPHSNKLGIQQRRKLSCQNGREQNRQEMDASCLQTLPSDLSRLTNGRSYWPSCSSENCVCQLSGSIPWALFNLTNEVTTGIPRVDDSPALPFYLLGFLGPAYRHLFPQERLALAFGHDTCLMASAASFRMCYT